MKFSNFGGEPTKLGCPHMRAVAEAPATPVLR